MADADQQAAAGLGKSGTVPQQEFSSRGGWVCFSRSSVPWTGIWRVPLASGLAACPDLP
jgi:hypothetical protein